MLGGPPASPPAAFPRPGGGGGRVAPPSGAAGGAARRRPPGSGAAVTRGAPTEPRLPVPVSGRRGRRGARGPFSQPRRAVPSPASLTARSGRRRERGGFAGQRDGLRSGTGRGRARGVPPGLGGPRGGGGAGLGWAELGSAGLVPALRWGRLLCGRCLTTAPRSGKGPSPECRIPAPQLLPGRRGLRECPRAAAQEGEREGGWEVSAAGRGRGASPSCGSWRNKPDILGLKVFRNWCLLDQTTCSEK